MARRLMAAGLLACAMALPMQEARAQDVLGGAPGIVIGAAAGAIIANEGQRRRNGYYYHRNDCYLQRADGAWVRVSQRYCAEPVEYRPAPNDAVAYCMQRYRSYDPVSQTYVGFDGMRRPCP
jgi:BA14K-like protein